MTDPEIRDEAIKEFMDFAVSKFNNGIREHNSCGTKGLWRMTPLQLCRAIKEEAADQWFYANAIEQKLLSAKSKSICTNPECFDDVCKGGCEENQ